MIPEGEMELDPLELSNDRARGDAMSCFNKSMDMGRHTVSKKSGATKPSSIQSSMHAGHDSNLFGESFATMGESFMGESFANMGEASFAYLAAGEGDYSYSDSNDDGDLEVAQATHRPPARQELETVIDIEEEEEEDDEPSQKGSQEN